MAAMILCATAIAMLTLSAAAFAGNQYDYPWRTAAPTGQWIEWWVDENGNGRFDRGSGEAYSPYGYNYRNCTDFCAYRLDARNGFRIPPAIGGASLWVSWARNRYPVNSTPAVGAIAWFSFGHVAWVESVNANGTITIEEYNYDYKGNWNERDIAATSVSSFIHFKDMPSATLPAKPLNPGCTSGTSTSLNMIWTDASKNEDDFVVQYRVGTGAWSSKVRVAGANGTSGTVSGLTPGLTYTLQVGARNAAGTHWSAYFYGVTKPAAVTRSTVVIDDPAAAFYGPPYWNTGYVGYGGSVHWTKNAVSATENYAIWRPNLAGGNYEVQVFIPSNYANTRNAVYQIYTGYGWASRSVNQEPYSNVWISLGTYSFTAGTGAYVQLNDATGEPYLSRMIGFDAVQFIPR